jgi:hypothetical protein
VHTQPGRKERKGIRIFCFVRMHDRNEAQGHSHAQGRRVGQKLKPKSGFAAAPGADCCGFFTLAFNFHVVWPLNRLCR